MIKKKISHKTLMPSLRLKKAQSGMKSNKGIAILIALFSMTFMVFLAMEVSYESSVDYLVASKEVNRLKAYYAARSGADLALLRVRLYKQAVSQFGETLGGQQDILNLIWQMPFAWPPQLPQELAQVDKQGINKTVKESIFQGKYQIFIESENNKIDINALASPIKPLRGAIKEQILKLFQNAIDNNEQFSDKYSNYDFSELINNIIDWIDEDNESLTSGDEGSLYSESGQLQPTNQSFKTMDELHLVAGMNDDFYKILTKNITIYGSGGININSAQKETLMSIDPQLTADVIKELLIRRNDPDIGPFKNKDNFYNFLEQQGVDIEKFNPYNIPIYFFDEFNFRITSVGEFANSQRKIEIVTFDVGNLKNQLVNQLEEEEKRLKEEQGIAPDSKNQSPEQSGKETTGQDSTGSTSGGKKNENQKTPYVAPEGRPTIVYWYES